MGKSRLYPGDMRKDVMESLQRAQEDAASIKPTVLKHIAAFEIEPVMLLARYEDDPVGLALVDRYQALLDAFEAFAVIAADRIVKNIDDLWHVVEQRNKAEDAVNEMVRRMAEMESTRPMLAFDLKSEKVADQISTYQQQILKTFGVSRTDLKGDDK